MEMKKVACFLKKKWPNKSDLLVPKILNYKFSPRHSIKSEFSTNLTYYVKLILIFRYKIRIHYNDFWVLESWPGFWHGFLPRLPLGATGHICANFATCSWEPLTMLNPHFVAGEHRLFGGHKSEDIRTFFIKSLIFDNFFSDWFALCLHFSVVSLSKHE